LSRVRHASVTRPIPALIDFNILYTLCMFISFVTTRHDASHFVTSSLVTVIVSASAPDLTVVVFVLLTELAPLAHVVYTKSPL
jgi:hypothetical protein